MKKRLLDIKGFSDTKVDKVKEAAKKMTVWPITIPRRGVSNNRDQPYAHTFMTALDLKEMRKRCIRISSGSKQLDSILNGYISVSASILSRADDEIVASRPWAPAKSMENFVCR